MEKTSKMRAIEICRNLQRTIDTMGDARPIESDHMYGFQPRAKKEFLQKQRRELIDKYSLTKKELR